MSRYGQRSWSGQWEEGLPLDHQSERSYWKEAGALRKNCIFHFSERTLPSGHAQGLGGVAWHAGGGGTGQAPRGLLTAGECDPPGSCCRRAVLTDRHPSYKYCIFSVVFFALF